MKKIAFSLIILSCLFILKPVYSAQGSLTPGRLLIVGGVVGGVEVIRGLIKLLSGDEDEQKDIYGDKGGTNILASQELEELEKYELLDRLTAKSRLFDVIEGKTEASSMTNEEIKLLIQKIIERKPKQVRKGILTDEEIHMVQVWTQNMAKVDVAATNLADETNHQSIKQYDITPFEAQFEFHHKTTNIITGDVSTESQINYYEVGKAYFVNGKKKKAKEYFLRIIAEDTNPYNKVSKGKAIVFLETYYNMPLDKIIREVKEYRRK